MAAWVRRSPGLTRVTALAITAAVIAMVGPRYGSAVNWGVAIIYGLALAIAMRWPVIMAGTGIRVILPTGLIMEALWYHGLATALVMLLVEFAVRILITYRGRYYWEWHRPIFVLTSLSVAYGIQVLFTANQVPLVHRNTFHFDTPAFVMVYVYWTLLNAGWTAVNAPAHGRTRMQELLFCLQQTWWVPLTFLAVGWPLEWVHAHGYPVEVLACLLLIWVQSLVGPVFTTLNQDRAVARYIEMQPSRYPEERLVVHRIQRLAHSMGRALSLSPREMRLLGYAALLQNWGDPGAKAPPLWFREPLSPAQKGQVRTYVEQVVRNVESDGALQEVAAIIRCRYADHDGAGYPEIAGDAVPIVAQVLAISNAITVLTGAAEHGPEAGAQAIQWLRTNASSRFNPQVLWAAAQAFSQPAATIDVERGLPEAVGHLRRLVGDPGRPSPLWVGLRHMWQQFWGQLGVAPDLPAEVQAMARLSTFFASSTDTDRTAQIAAEAVGRLIGAKVAVALREKGQTELAVTGRATYGFTGVNLVGLKLYLSAGPLNRAMLEQAPIQVADLRELQAAVAQEVASAEGIRSALFLPIVNRGKTIGLLLVGLQRQHWFTPREVGLIQLMAAQAAAAIENADLIAEAEQRLAHITSLKTFTDTLLDNLSTCIIVVDPEGRVMMTNAAARNRFGIGMPLVVGQRLFDDLAAAAQVDRALGGEPTPEVDWSWNGAILEVQSVPLQYEHGVTAGAICLARDVAEVRAMEQQVRRVEKLAAIGELAAGAAHEIRNPLTSIRGFIQLMQHKAATGDGDFFQIILSEIDRIDWIIRDMLLLARPSELVRQEINIGAMLDEVLLMHQTELLRTNIAVVREYEPEAQVAAVDPKMFRQLLLNLILNAMQAMPYGGALRLSIRREGEGQIAVQVADTGVGISAENLKRLFVPFFTTKEEGTGLGLALCYSIVQAHGGRIDVESHVGHGTAFTITIPIK